MTERESIDREILRLTERKQELLDKERDLKRKSICSLEWAKGLKCSFSENHFAPYGNTEYILRFHDRDREKFLEGVVDVWSGMEIRGDSKHYQDNLRLKKGEISGYELVTSNAELFMAILEEIRPQIEPDASFTKRVKVMSSVAACIKCR